MNGPQGRSGSYGQICPCLSQGIASQSAGSIQATSFSGPPLLKGLDTFSCLFRQEVPKFFFFLESTHKICNVCRITHQIFLSFKNIISLRVIVITSSVMKALSYPMPLPTHLHNDRLVQNALPTLAKRRHHI